MRGGNECDGRCGEVWWMDGWWLVKVEVRVRVRVARKGWWGVRKSWTAGVWEDRLKIKQAG